MEASNVSSESSLREKLQFSQLWTRIRMVIGLILLATLGAAAFIYRAELRGSVGTRRTFLLFMAVFCLSWLLAFILIFLHPNFSPRTAAALNSIFTLCVPPFIYLTAEMVTCKPKADATLLRKMFGDTLYKPNCLIINLVLISLLLVLLILIFNSVRVGSELCALIIIVFAIVNIYVTDFRGAAITACDLTVLSTALDVAGEYRPAMYVRVLQALMNLLLLVIAAGRLRFTRLSKSFKAYGLNIICIALLCLCGRYVLFSGYLKQYLRQVSYFTTISNYRHYGVVLTFSRSIADAFPNKPDSYSLHKVEELAARYPSDKVFPAEGVSESNPNIIIIINEAFSDLHLLGNFETTENELAFFDSLTDNCISGISYSSILGSRTANTEFEILTGHSMASLPFGAVPFQTYIKSDLPSFLTLMDQENYAGLFALHPCPKTNYNRIKAYPYLGFKAFYDDSDAPLPLQTIRKYCSDASCYDNILHICEEIRTSSDQPVFAYCMTMQNHSPYDMVSNNFTSDVHVTDLKASYPDVDQYLSLIKATDDALSDLVDRLSAIDEPTVLLFVGDHQPSLDKTFYKEIRDKKNETIPRLLKYQVPFRIWANFELRTQENVTTSMNYLQTYLADFTGMRRTGYQKFLTELRERIPVITLNGYVGDDGQYYEVGDTESPYYDLMQDYACLEYNALFDTDHRLTDFFDFAD